jgi:hypothetical protein
LHFQRWPHIFSPNLHIFGNNASEWTCEISSKIFHVMFLIYSFSMWQTLDDMTKYSMPCQQIFCQITCIFFLWSTMVYWLWTWVWQIELSIATYYKGLKIKENKSMHFIIPGEYFKCLKLLERKYKIFKTIEMGGNCTVDKYLMKLNS